MVRIEKMANGTPYTVHDGGYTCCPDCKARLERDDKAGGPAQRLAQKAGRKSA